MLEKAIIIATMAHKGQLDKGGQPYIFHPLRVMMNVETENERICAVLHDVIEDTSVTAEYLLKEGFSEDVVNAILSVSKINKYEEYLKFIERVKLNPIGRKVKIADLMDNMVISRLSTISDQDVKRMEKYKKAYAILTEE